MLLSITNLRFIVGLYKVAVVKFQVVLAKEFCDSKVEEWKMKEKNEERKIPSEEKWKQLYNHFSDL